MTRKVAPYVPGCPIRRSQSQCSVTSSSGLFAGSHVLHRLSTPRHPPHALINFVTPTRPRPEHLATRTAQTTRPEGSHRPAKSGAFKLPLLLSNSFARQEQTCQTRNLIGGSLCCLGELPPRAGGDRSRLTADNDRIMTCQRGRPCRFFAATNTASVAKVASLCGTGRIAEAPSQSTRGHRRSRPGRAGWGRGPLAPPPTQPQPGVRESANHRGRQAAPGP